MKTFKSIKNSGRHSMLYLITCFCILSYSQSEAQQSQSNSGKSDTSYSDSSLLKIKNDYELRRSEAFEKLRGKPLVKVAVRPPVFSNGSNFSRGYSYSLLDFAFKCFWLNEQIQEANDALIENSNYYIGYPAAYKDRDSFYWATDELCSILELFGSKGSKKAGLVSKATEDRIYLMMWQYSKMQSKIAKAEYEISKTWYVDESENHHVQRFYAAWHFAKFLKDQPQYKDLKYDDGFTAKEHYSAWTIYIKHWILERAKKGLFIEMANDSYGLETLKGVYNFYDFGGDNKMKELAGQLLDLYWAAWAQEQLSGVRGGGKSRVYPNFSYGGRSNFWNMAWYYLGINELRVPKGNLNTLITSSYRMPLVVMDMALDALGKGKYEITQRRLGLAENGFYSPPNYHLLQNGGLTRYSYCTPEFIAGTLFFEARPYEDWTMISSQNRWVGVIFKGDPDSRIYPQCKTGKKNRAFNQIWCVQKKGSIIVQKLQDSIQSRSAGEMQLWISKAGISDQVENEGWVFLKTKESYVAIRCTDGGYSWQEDIKGRWLVCENKYSPIIIEVASQADYTDYEQFQNKIKTLNYTVNNEKLTYKSLNNDVLTLPINHKGIPEINGAAIDLAPPMVMDSPFVKSKYDSGVIVIQKDNRKLTLDFNF